AVLVALGSARILEDAVDRHGLRHHQLAHLRSPFREGCPYDRRDAQSSSPRGYGQPSPRTPARRTGGGAAWWESPRTTDQGDFRWQPHTPLNLLTAPATASRCRCSVAA